MQLFKFALILSALLFCSIAAKTAKHHTMRTGASVGGWLILEPWITPSLFYRFLGRTGSQGVGMDSWTVCETLGPVEGNMLMRAHWRTWFNETHMQALAERGVEYLRLPIGDWTLRGDQYGPYAGCMDGAEDQVDWLLDTAAQY